MDDATFFASPISTLVDSLTSSAYTCHDLLDAYATLNTRLTSSVRLLSQEKATFRALEVIQENAVSLAHAIRRDLLRARKEPCLDVDPVASGSSVTALELRVQALQNEVAVCHAAVQLLATLFKHPPLSGLIRVEDAVELINDILTLATSPFLPTPNSKKTKMLCTLVVFDQRLPCVVIRGHMSLITSLLKSVLCDGWEERMHVECLKSIHLLLVHDGPSFLEPFARSLVPSCLLGINSTSPTIQAAAAHALSGFALAVASSSSPAPACFDAHIWDYFQAQTTRKPEIDKSTLLHAVLHRSSAPWKAAVLGSLAILFPSFFQHRRALRLYGAVIADLQTDTAKPNANVALAAGVWTCGIWNLANLPSGTKASEEEITRRGQAIDVLNQMQRGGAGVALVAALLGSKPGGPGYDSHDVPRALKTIVKMIRNKDKAVSRDGLSAVLRIMGQPSSVLSSNASVEEQPWTHVSLVPRTLLSTCALASPTFDAAVALRADRIDIDFIRVLADAEILENWDACIHAWKEGLQVILGLSSVILASGVAPSKRMTQDFVVESRDGLVRVWQTLLLAQTQLTQELEHLTASPTLASSVAKILVDVLRLDLPGSTSVEATQSVRLGISTQLWSVAKNVFVREWLVPVADEVLATLLAGVDEPVSTQVTDMWCVLTSRVALCASQGAGPLLAIVNRPEFHPKAGPLWSALANTIGKRRKTRQSDFVDVLVAGLRVASLTEEYHQLWRSVYDVASSPSLSSGDSVLDLVMTSTRGDPNLVLAMFSMCSAPDFAIKISEDILDACDGAGTAFYQSASPDVLVDTRWIATARTCIGACSMDRLPSVVTHLGKSLLIWISDEHTVFSDDEYNTTVIPVYSEMLKRLASHRDVAGLTGMDDFVHLLLAPFRRVPVPPPGLGPTAFASFCDAVFVEATACPDRLRPYLRLCARAESQSVLNRFNFPSSDPVVDEGDILLRSNPLGSPVKTPRPSHSVDVPGIDLVPSSISLERRGQAYDGSSLEYPTAPGSPEDGSVRQPTLYSLSSLRYLRPSSLVREEGEEDEEAQAPPLHTPTSRRKAISRRDASLPPSSPENPRAGAGRCGHLSNKRRRSSSPETPSLFRTLASGVEPEEDEDYDDWEAPLVEVPCVSSPDVHTIAKATASSSRRVAALDATFKAFMADDASEDSMDDLREAESKAQKLADMLRERIQQRMARSFREAKRKRMS